MNETATTASKADRTELCHYVPLCRTAVREWVSGHRDACVQGLPARPSACSLPSPCAGTASQAPSMLTSTSVCRDSQPGPQHAHFHVRVQGLPARPPACSLPRPCAGTASQAPSMLPHLPLPPFLQSLSRRERRELQA